ncbi:MAG: 50S ribosomal protein L7/L12 [Candidatus Zixiibacteriota bacterium]
MAETSTIDQVVGLIENMSVMELSQLSKTLQDKFGVSAAAPMMMGAMPAAGGGAAAAVEEKTEFTPHLTQVGDKKIQVIKVIREITGLGLKEAKDLVDKAPNPVKENVSKEEAESIRAKLQEVGAVVEIK